MACKTCQYAHKLVSASGSKVFGCARTGVAKRDDDTCLSDTTPQPGSLDYDPAPVAKGFEEFADQAAAQTAEGRGLRYNQGKSRVDLLPPDFIMALANLMTVNEAKYPDRNWEKGMPWSDVLASLERHFISLKAGEDIDPTDGQHHAVKIAWNAMAMFCYYWREIGTDDRVKVKLPTLEAPTHG